MIDIHNLDGLRQNYKTYGGTAGVKIGLTINGEDYLVKYPGKLKYANMKNVEISYSNSPVCEYIGCKIYESMGIPVQEVALGIRNQKIVVLCKDFLGRGEALIPFRDIKATFEPTFTDPQGDITNGTGTNLNEILRALKEHPLLVKYPQLTERFWDMFVVDAFIGNPDRNNENWGFIRDMDDNYRVAPVFDCGNCLNNKLSEDQMKQYLNDPFKLEEAALQRPCIFERAKDKRINPNQYIRKMQNDACNRAVQRIVPNIDLNVVKKILDEIPQYVLNDTAKVFYKELLKIRYEKVLEPTLQKIQEQSKDLNLFLSEAKKNIGKSPSKQKEDFELDER